MRNYICRHEPGFIYFISFQLPGLSWVLFFITLAFLLFIISFFRVPARVNTIGEKYVVCPADGKVVVIEEITDVEYFHDRRLQVSIFMSPANVHRNVNPIGGDVIYSIIKGNTWSHGIQNLQQKMNGTVSLSKTRKAPCL